MSKRLLTLALLILMVPLMVFSQTINLETYGISPRDAEADTLDVFDRAFNSLLNVGVETQMYLKGSMDTTLVSPAWAVTSAPVSSIADIGTLADMDSATQVAVFTPDIVGTYVLDFSANGLTATVTINAGLYVGIGDQVGCAGFCHSGTVSDWEGTGHADALIRGLDGLKHGASFQGYCVSCHATGYDALASNDGFDDFAYVHPDTFYVGMADSIIAAFPDAMARGNIQCESCHGPGDAHNGSTSDSKMVSSLDAATCASCHDAGTHHVYPEQWDVSGHANPPARDSWSSSCAKCHTAGGFIQFAKGETVESQDSELGISCAACHDPHSKANEHQVRIVEATLANDEIVIDGGSGKLCMNCHQSRREANSYTERPGGHFGPHYMPQADMLIGTNVVTFGKNLPTSPHAADVENSCVTCHMAPAHVDEEDNVILVGSHSFNVVDENGIDNVAICQDCHGNVGETFAEKKYYFNGNADHDGDGTAEGLQDEVHGMMDELAAMLPHADSVAAYDPHDDVDDTWTKTELKAAYNLEMVYYDHSYGIHNPAFTVALLKVSMEALATSALAGEIVAIDDIPNDQGKSVKIIWDKMTGDGVAPDPVEKYIVKRYDAYDDTWTGLGEHTADGSMRYALVVPTIFDSTAEGDGMTDFKVVSITASGEINESVPAAGFSVDNLIPMAPINPAALVANSDVNITWESTIDPDINYYRIYRSDVEGFEPASANEIGTTTILEFLDNSAESGTYYYKVAAVDFSGNLGEFSVEINANVTGIDGGSEVPLEFGLSQNYPNPFNPTTAIDFSILTSGKVTLTVYNTVGQEIITLVDRELAAGTYSTNFSAVSYSSGVYFYRITVTNAGQLEFQAMHKMILVK